VYERADAAKWVFLKAVDVIIEANEGHERVRQATYNK